MITGEGGCITRSMPPTNWDHGPIPEACYNPDLSDREIMALLLPVYLEEDRVKRLAGDDEDLWRTRWKIEMVAEIDAYTLWVYNMTRNS